MDTEKTNTQTTEENLYSIIARVQNSRSLLDLVAEYLVSGGIDVEPADRLETVLYAVERARDEAKKAEEALYNYSPHSSTPYKTGTAESVSISADEQETIDAIVLGLWEEWMNELAEDGKEPEEEANAVRHFAELMGCKVENPLCMMFRGFRSGVGYGIELLTRTEKNA